MKICQLKIKNLGPFHVKPVELDFGNGPLADTSLVAITGRTGAGKTMLFDAICVALYGKTPRLDGIGDKNPKHLLSHGKSDGHAEVIFETNGIRYLAEWSIKGDSPSGKLIKVANTELITDRLNSRGTSTGSSERTISDEIESILGLDFNAFKRSVMLAQGEFSEFLKAKPADTLEILAAVADLGIYDDLGDALREKMKAVRADLKTVLGKLAAILAVVNLPELTDARGVLRDLDDVLGRNGDPGEIGNEFVSCDLDVILGVLREKVSEEKETLCRLKKDARALNKQAQEYECQKSREEERTKAFKELQSSEERLVELHAQSGYIKTLQEELDRAKRANQLRSEKVVYDTAKSEFRDAKTKLSKAQEELNQRLADFIKVLDEQIASLSNLLTALDEQIQAAVKFIAENPLPVDRQERLHLRDLAVLVDPIKELRQKLEDGEPCLVCGAMEHPHAHEIASEREPAPDLPLWDAIPADLRELGLTLEEAFAQLVKRINAVEEREEERDTKQIQLERLDCAIETTQRDLESAKEQRKSVRANIERYQREGNAFLAAASEKTGGLTTESEVHAAIENLNAALQVMTKSRDGAEQALNVSKTLLTEAQTEYDRRSSLLETARTAYLVKLSSAGFTSPEEHEAAFRENAWIEKTEAKIADYTQERHRLEVVIAERRPRFEETPFDPEELGRITAKLAEIEEKIQKKREDIGAQRTVIPNLEKALSNFNDSAKAVRKAYEEFERWNDLRLAIAHPTPMALGHFALRVVLEQVSQFANTQLESLTSGRYQLKVEVIGKFSGIQLTVVDKWNANEERPVETLSGGESFLASFALALGLSEISRGRAEIGSLFLDEGFGTLDAETLDIVIDELQRLRLQGRSIFLISHIERLTKHLPAEIRVEKEINAGSTVHVG